MHTFFGLFVAVEDNPFHRRARAVDPEGDVIDGFTITVREIGTLAVAAERSFDPTTGLSGGVAHLTLPWLSEHMGILRVRPFGLWGLVGMCQVT